jgi:hypothetical protein
MCIKGCWNNQNHKKILGNLIQGVQSRLIVWTIPMGSRHYPSQNPIKGTPSVSGQAISEAIRFVGVCEGQCLRPPRCRQHYTSSRHGSERPVQTLIRKFSTTCGRRLNIGLMLLKLLVARTLNFINDKLLFIKLF